MSIGHRFTGRAAARRLGLAVVALAAFAAPTALAAGPAAAAPGAGTPRPQVSAGDTIYADSGTACKTVVNARSGGTYYVIMPGHCTQGTSAWYTDAALTTYIGPTVATSFPGNDYGLVRYDNPAVPHPGGGFTAGNAYVGERVCRTTTAGPLRCGTVTALNATVNYGGGQVVSGLIATTVCTDPGDTGGLLAAGSTAIGLFSGGSGNCSAGGTSYYQPLTEVLAAFGLSLY
ncbi:S1 family peptidase [Streptomyces cocklensis]|uniref:Streptogrisin B n=1 Tax=Actinacidiphila cocklensis TaxID=887465 RepID=A0A9W4DZM2_9ACTN|nr:S1 family peptidase [Actinacidiphila cocklensis]MDD1063351.1 S1 family peptidase [Actinacidiphila cocklensis]CAG6399066.1 Streptogrisin B [Actinacidiphila cocklensis]